MHVQVGLQLNLEAAEQEFVTAFGYEVTKIKRNKAPTAVLLAPPLPSKLYDKGKVPYLTVCQPNLRYSTVHPTRGSIQIRDWRKSRWVWVLYSVVLIHHTRSPTFAVAFTAQLVADNFSMPFQSIPNLSPTCIAPKSLIRLSIQ